MTLINLSTPDISCFNLSLGEFKKPSGAEIKVRSPYTGQVIGTTFESSKDDIDGIVAGAQKGFETWGKSPLKERMVALFNFRRIVLDRINDMAHVAALESGKTQGEAKAGILKGIEVVEYALSLQNLDNGASLDVSRGVSCTQIRMPLGVTVGIAPFNFPAMVPLWMYPIAIACGNSFILKPSEKVPLTSHLMGQAMLDAGFPKGVFSIANGGVETVNALIDHPDVKAVGFVGSTKVASQIYSRSTSQGKRCLALGGAKNHIILAPDADPDMTVAGIVSSYTGCAGQRCMAASVLLAVGDCDAIIDKVVARAKSLKLGSDMGAIITPEALSFLHDSIGDAVREGATLRLDGRQASGTAPKDMENGYWIGATVLDNVKPQMACATKELFGPIISIIRVKNLTEALAIEKASSYGNATSVFTNSGAVARRVQDESTSGMIGINIGVPVPREPFSFGGTKASKFGHGDITGDASLDFWSNLKKVTQKWSKQDDSNWMS